MSQNQNFVPANYFPASSPMKRPSGSGSLLQWFNALPCSNGRAMATGWHIQASRCSEELTAALKDFGYEKVSIFHRSTNNNEEYWKIERCSLFILCNGFENAWEMRNTDDRQGLAFGWQGGKGSTKLKSRVIIAELALMGCYEPLTTSMEGFQTEEFLNALSEQFKVLDAFKAQFSLDAPFYGFSLEIAPANKNKMVGRGKDQSPIIPTVAVIPMIDAEYFTAHIAPPEVLRYIAENGLIEKTIRWSIDTSFRINEGSDKEVWETDEYNQSLGKSSSVPRTPRPPVQAEQSEAAPEETADPMDAEPATKQQLTSIHKLCTALNKQIAEPATFGQAKELLKSMSQELRDMRSKSK